MFIGRKQELQFLEDKYNSKNGQLVVLYGRRRVGKTAVLWDSNNRIVVWTSDLHSYLENDSELCYAEFNDNTISIYGSISGVELALSDGTIKNCFKASERPSQNYDDWLDNGCIPQNTGYMNLQEDILRQLPHFKNCDFSEAVFEFDKYKELLKKMGAII